MKTQQVPISEAARLVGRNRKSLYRDIDAGRLSATVGDTGIRQVAISELLRVYGSFRVSRDTTKGDTKQQSETLDATTLQVLVASLEAENKQLRAIAQKYEETLKAENAQLRELLTAKDKNLDDLRSTIKLLEYEIKSHHKTGFWSRIFRTKDHL